MPRDSSGNYSLPSTVNPVLTGTVISSTWANTTLNDLATEMTDSLDRSGKGGMISAFKLADGSAGAPGLAFVSEPTTGFYRVGAGQIGVSIAGSNVATFTSTGATLLGQNTTIVGQLYLNVTGSSPPTNGLYAASGTTLGFAAGSNVVGNVTSAGAWTFNGSIIATSTSGSITVNSTTGTNAAASFYSLAGVGKVRFGTEGTAGTTITGSSVGDAFVFTTGGNFIISTNTGGGVAFRVDSGNGLSQCLDESGTLWDIGFRDMPGIVNSGALAITLTHRSKLINQQTANTITIPSNASIPFAIGAAFAVVNFSGGTVTVAITTDTMFLAGTVTTGSRTIAPNGMGLFTKGGTTTWLASGPGVG